MGSVVTSDGVRISVYDLGGRGAPVLLAHAAGFHGRSWAPVAARLVADFRCVAFDARGHGESTKSPGSDFDWSGFAIDALAVVEGLKLHRPYGVGHSSGATSLLLAEQAQPGTFTGLYCYEPIIVPSDIPLGRDADNWLANSARRRREVFPSRTEALQYLSTRPALSTLAVDAIEAYVQYGFEDVLGGGVRLRCRACDEALVYEMASANDCFGRLAEVRCPVTIASGQKSTAMGPPAIEPLLARLPSASCHAVPNVGHLGPLEDPEMIARSILRSVRRLPDANLVV